MNFIIQIEKISIKSNTLLIVRLDSIGDYILFRNFLQEIRESEQYRNYKIYLCGNIVWKNLAENLDNKFIDEFIWISRNKFKNNLRYKFNILKQIHKLGVETVIETTFTREILFGDEIVRVSNAKERIGSSASQESYSKWKRKLLTDKYYTKLISSSNENLFEFYRNKEFFTQLLQENNDSDENSSLFSEVEKPVIQNINIELPSIIKNKFIVIFPGGSSKNKMWASKYFKDVAKFILENYTFDIVLTGSKQEEHLFNEIMIEQYQKRFINLFGNTLLELAKLISESELLISNDTSAIHFAAAVNIPFICFTNGNHYGRFFPYPKEIFDKGIYIYPQEIKDKINLKEVQEKLRYKSDFDINTISPVEVIDKIKLVIPEELDLNYN
ncbi:MAG: glycosyltransferase family 9 protein [Ignavibacterium sp.]